MTTQRFKYLENKQYWRCDCWYATFIDSAQLPKVAEELEQYTLHQNDIYDAGYRRFLANIATPLLAKLPAEQNGLDYGCGPGPALATMLTEAGHNMAVYDPFFYQQDDVLNKQYDFITCTEVAEHFHQPADEISKLNTLLKPGGWLGIMTQFQTNDDAFEHWHYRHDPTHVVFYKQQTFIHLAAQLGWYCEIPCKNVVLLQKPISD